jgi:PAS domain S-box-containing protein
MKTRRWLEVAGLAVAVAILSVIAVLDYATTEAFLATSQRIDDTRQALEALDEAVLGTTAAGRIRRTYSLTHDATELPRVKDAIDQARDALARVRALTLDDPGQQDRIERIEPLFAQRFADIDSAVATAIAGGSGEAQEEAMSRQSNALMREIASRVDDMRDDERRLLQARQEEVNRRAAFAKAVGIGGTALSIGLIVLVFARLRTENRRRQVAQEAADRATAFLDSIVEHIPDMIVVKEAAGLRVERINRAGEAMLGRSREEMLGKNDFAFFPRSQAAVFHAKDREALDRGTAVDVGEEPMDTPDGVRWVHTKKVPLLGGDGRPRFLLGISADVTERKRTAEALRAARDTAQNANRELESFSYSVAHDLRAPLRGIDGFSQALLEDCGDQLDDTGHQHLQRVRAAAQRMGELIDSLLAVARLARTELRSETVDLSALAAASVADLRNLDPGRDVDVVIEPSMRVRGDPRLLRVVLDNLLGNAFKFTAKRAKGEIEFASRTEDGERVFFVRDNGVGFDPRYAGNLFRVFQRLHDAREFPGTGIGLATVQRVILRHGGRTWARSEPGQGATFYFTLRTSELAPAIGPTGAAAQ